MPASLLLTNLNQVVTLRGTVPRRGAALSNPGVIRGGAVLIAGGKIAAAGPRGKIESLPEARYAAKVDAGGRIVLPGFVDSHTHFIFAGSRADEYEQRIAGANYEEIARKGGGILSTVRKLRSSSPDALKKRAEAALKRFAEHGTTTIEAKSGYGLDVASEFKILQLQRELRRTQPVDILSTLLGAHVLPPEYRGRGKSSDDYVELLVQRMIPEIAREGLAEFCDVFCDRGAFTVTQARKILTAGRACGLVPRLHAEQLARTGATQLGVALHAASCDHLEKINRADIRALAQSDTVATLLPGSCFHLGLNQYAPARALIEAGAIVCLATDYNPGTSPTLSMATILSLACTQMRMTPAETLAAATSNAAFSIGRHKQIGSIERGKLADLAVFDLDDYREIPYYFGVNHVWLTLKRGQPIFSRNS
ncbi:MAG TPA: imidazolonepropionase [Candidatus Dormibacteraeota bacterium]|nr:imidazolonepropionase [Candidatus Dormibacteraeota bacterium]